MTKRQLKELDELCALEIELQHAMHKPLHDFDNHQLRLIVKCVVYRIENMLKEQQNERKEQNP